ncbi:serine hydrolase domain-containing protein [Streptomyces sp. NPDC015350]|uniref:serine hydrolase domain-containing protein n=1 Tax=Streptomyces sp. NPDC015350 TaxID=3364955 RepID=UPI0036FB0FE0
MGTRDRIRIGSITKVFVATVVLQLVAEGRVALDAPVRGVLPGLLPARFSPVTVAHLLNHTSGLPDHVGVPEPKTVQEVLRHRFDRWTPREWVATATHGPLKFAPGTRQEYRGINYVLAALFSGELLPPERLEPMFTLPPEEVRMLDGSPARYSTGLQRATVNGVALWGRTGKTYGYRNAVFSTRDQRRRFVLAHHPTAVRGDEEGRVAARVADLLTRDPSTGRRPVRDARPVKGSGAGEAWGRAWITGTGPAGGGSRPT